jgi:hypothetical protein
MRFVAWWLVLLLTLSLAVPALAEDDDDWDDDEEEEESEGWAGYGETVGNRYLMGVTSVATFLGDPPMEVVFPQKEWDDLPLAFVSKRVVGLGQGLLLSAYRAGMGTLDLVFAPLTPMKMLSPEPRWNLFDLEHDEY